MISQLGIRNSIRGEANIQLGMETNQSEYFILPIGRSFLFFDNVGDNLFAIFLEDMSRYVIDPVKAGIITLDLPAPIQTKISILCPTRACQGLVMMTSCAD